jgi:ADP-dependent NAD(P)H-hydrate dehydratase / NAD(P)H-hydrate epimerase
MQPLINASSMREIDGLTVRQYQIPEVLLMEHAAMGLVGALVSRFQRLLPRTRGLVLAGHGNNGADAIATARILWNNGQRSICIVVDATQKPSPLCALQLNMAKKLGIPVLEALTPEAFQAVDWILDGIFGVGLSRAPEGTYLEWIEMCSQYGRNKYIVAVDVPSGVDASRGTVLGKAITANRTVTFGFYKTGLVTGEALNHVGILSLAAVQIPRELAEDRTEAMLLEASEVRAWLPLRLKNSHKGSFGRVGILSSHPSMAGASALCALGALRSGAGLVEVLHTGEPLERSLFPVEVMLHEWEKSVFGDRSAVDPNAVLVVGPGLGMSEPARLAFAKALTHPGSLVLDADGLNLLAEASVSQWTERRAGLKTILTPHPKEAARLLKTTVELVQADRLKAAHQLAKKFQSVVVLKGAGSIVVSEKYGALINPTGDPGLAKGGTGDVLAGICAGFLAQNLGDLQAAAAAAFLHGRASEILTNKHGQNYSTAASDVANALVQAISEV